MIVNPGSVGLPGYEDDRPEQHVIESGSPHARYAILDITDDRCDAQLLAISYDARRAADQARGNNRDDWAVALETGFMTR